MADCKEIWQIICFLFLKIFCVTTQNRQCYKVCSKR